jgi:hypothetical protein
MRVRGGSGWRGTILIALALAACSDSEPTATAPTSGGQSEATETSVELWPAPADPMALAVDAGLVPEIRESFVHHVHAHLDVFVDGEHITVPAGIGIDITDPGVRHAEVDGQIGYGGIEGCDEPCISPLHTHDVTGIIHTESPSEVDNTLGQFFIEWGQPLDADCVATFCEPDEAIEVYVDGELYDGDLADIGLSDGREIAIVIGTPPAEIPASADFSAA